MEIVVHNIHGRIDNVIGLLKREHTGELLLDYCDERFMCSCCSRPIHRNKTSSTGMFVDSQGMAWCRSCWVRCLKDTVLATDKHPDDDAPKFIHRGGKYYQRLDRSLYEARLTFV